MFSQTERMFFETRNCWNRCCAFASASAFAIAFASSLDQAGPITRNVSDAAMMLNSMVGYDPKDSTSAKKDKIDFLTYKNNLSLKGLKIGIPKEYQVDSMSNEILSLWERGSSWLKSRGAEICAL